MKNTPPSLQQLNRTFIGSVLFLDIVGYSCRTVPDQLAMKEMFNSLLTEAVHNVSESERIMVDTGDGAAIAFLGDPEDALFAALSLRDAIDAGKATLGEPGFVRMGINLGPLKMVRDINSHTNMIGDGVNDAQRVMSFAEPGQVMASHSYFDIISRFSRDYTKLFVYEGTRHDKHVREHEVYRFGPAEGAEKLTEQLTEKMRDRSRARQSGVWSDRIFDVNAQAGSGAGSNKAAVSSAQKRIAYRAGLIAAALGAIAITGAVWSWTSKPALKNPDGMPATASIAAAAVPEPARPVEIKSEKPAVVAVSAGIEKAPQAISATGTATPEKTAGKTEKKDDAAPVAKPGTVKLAVQPWGEVYVDGSKRGVSPPLKSLSLAPGKHRIEIRNGQFAPHKQTVEVKSSTETTVHYLF